jgi:two-component system invasion response regulator UvrY
MIRIYLVDDHELFRTGMRSILERNEDIQVVGEAASGEDAVAFIRDHDADIIMMDVNMPGIGGIEATRRILRIDPAAKIIAVTVLSEEPFPNQLLNAGARGYISKGCPADEMFSAIHTVQNGDPYISNEVARKLSLSSVSKKGEVSPLSKLSGREMQVMLMITQGQSTQEISDSLFLSPKTVSTYRHRLYEKLEVSNDVELTHYAIRHGLINRPQ